MWPNLVPVVQTLWPRLGAHYRNKDPNVGSLSLCGGHLCSDPSQRRLNPEWCPGQTNSWFLRGVSGLQQDCSGPRWCKQTLMDDGPSSIHHPSVLQELNLPANPILSSLLPRSPEYSVVLRGRCSASLSADREETTRQRGWGVEMWAVWTCGLLQRRTDVVIDDFTDVVIDDFTETTERPCCGITSDPRFGPLLLCMCVWRMTRSFCFLCRLLFN